MTGTLYSSARPFPWFMRRAMCKENPTPCTLLTQNTHKVCAATWFGLVLQRGGDGEDRLSDIDDASVLIHGAFAQRLPGVLFAVAMLLH